MTETTITEVPAGHRPRGRFPSFVGLARATGGVYVENTDGQHPDKILTAAGLDFMVSTTGAEATVLDADGVTRVESDKAPDGQPYLRAVVATWPGQDGTPVRRRLLGVVRRRYEIGQNHTLAQLGQGLLDEGGATCVAAGAYGEPIGSKVFMAFKLPEGIEVGGEDPHDLYLLMGTSHNGSTGNWGCIAPIRLTCTNQLAATFGPANPNRFTVRHTKSMAERLSVARGALSLTNTWIEAYTKAAEQLLDVPMGPRDLGAFLDKLMPTRATSERGENAAGQRRAQVAELALAAPTCEFGRGTRYATYQAVAEYADHLRPARSDVRRYTRVLDGDPAGEGLKTKAMSLLLAP